MNFSYLLNFDISFKNSNKNSDNLMVKKSSRTSMIDFILNNIRIKIQCRIDGILNMALQ